MAAGKNSSQLGSGAKTQPGQLRKGPMREERFDQSYYRRYYEAPQSRIAEPDYFERVSSFVASYLDMLDCRVSSVLDAGCGLGLLHAGLRRAWPRVRIDAFDGSEYACQRSGGELATFDTFRRERRYDLVLCHDVLQYLDRAEAGRAMECLTSWTKKALYFSVLTTEDWEENCDQHRTDGDVHLRAASWYRERLFEAFINIGGGLYVRRSAGLVVYALESC